MAAMGYRLNAAQKQALKRLSGAFAICHEAGLCFIGMDNHIRAYDKKALFAKKEELKDLYDAQMALDQGTQVDTQGSYIDSGGW